MLLWDQVHTNSIRMKLSSGGGGEDTPDDDHNGGGTTTDSYKVRGNAGLPGKPQVSH
jgi:hypothetical protein